MNLPRLRWRRDGNVVATVEQETHKAAALAGIAGQDLLDNPHTNPAVRPLFIDLRNAQHRLTIGAAHTRAVRRHRVETRRANGAEQALAALQDAREQSSPAKSVLALHASRTRYMRISLATSLVLAFGSAMGLEKIAETHQSIPEGSGYIAEVGLTGLATIVILARSDLTRHSGQLKAWQDAVLWTLMIAPLVASVAANVHAKNVIGAICAVGAAAFSLFSYVVAEAYAESARSQAKKVSGKDEEELHKIATGADPFAFRSREQVQGPVSDLPSDQVPSGSETHGSGRSDNGSETGSGDGSADRSGQQVSDPGPERGADPADGLVSDQVPDPAPEQVPDPPADGVDEQVPDPMPAPRPPKKRTRAKPKPKPLDRIDEARAADSAYLAEHGRHIPAEKLAKALRIGKPAALELVKQVRGGHIDIVRRKAVNQ